MLGLSKIAVLYLCRFVVIRAAFDDAMFFITERENVSIVVNTSGVQTATERLKSKAAQDAHRQHLKIPRRFS